MCETYMRVYPVATYIHPSIEIFDKDLLDFQITPHKTSILQMNVQICSGEKESVLAHLHVIVIGTGRECVIVTM